MSFYSEDLGTIMLVETRLSNSDHMLIPFLSLDWLNSGTGACTLTKLANVCLLLVEFPSSLPGRTLHIKRQLNVCWTCDATTQLVVCLDKQITPLAFLTCMGGTLSWSNVGFSHVWQKNHIFKFHKGMDFLAINLKAWFFIYNVLL